MTTPANPNVQAVFTAQKRRGRKTKPFEFEGNYYNGLYRKPGTNVYRITATGKEFSEPDERLAVARFLRETEGVKPVTLSIPFDDRQTYGVGHSVTNTATLAYDGDLETLALSQHISPHVLWPWLRKQLIERPDWVARQVGIEQIGYLADLRKPTASPSLKSLGQTYAKHADVRVAQRRNVERVWADFMKITGAVTLRDLTTELVLVWADDVKSRGLAAASVDAMYGKVKTVLGFAKKRGIDADELRRAVDVCAVLVPPKGGNTYEPHPITPEAFHKLLAASEGIDRAVILLSLNACLYASEALEMKWDEINLATGVLLTKRGKTGMVRAAVLWPQTIEALKSLPRSKSEFVFTSARGSNFHPNSFRKRFEDVRTAAKVGDKVKFSDIRDGAYSAAFASGCEPDHCKILAGHRCGMADHYVQRNPKMVAPACEGVYRAYFA